VGLGFWAGCSDQDKICLMCQIKHTDIGISFPFYESLNCSLAAGDVEGMAVAEEVNESWEEVTHHMTASAESWQATFPQNQIIERGGWRDEGRRARSLYLAQELTALAGENGYRAGLRLPATTVQFVPIK
jgi:hypothetical protein